MVAKDSVTLGGALNSHLSVDIPPVSNPGPVREMPVESRCGEGPKVAIIDVDGLLVNMNLAGLYSLGENPVNLFVEKLKAAGSNPAVCAVVVRINSPGGGVAATETMRRELRSFRAQTKLPVVAFLLDLGTGGAYYLATASDRIVAQPGTLIGGIGVIVNLYNLSDTMAYFNVRYQPIKAGQYIDMGTSTTALTPAVKDLLQGMADEYHARFRRTVEESRPSLNHNDSSLFDGRIFTDEQAQQRGLIDQVGFLDDAVAIARELAHQPQAGLVMYHRCNDPARSPYATSPNTPLQNAIWPVSVPGLDRSRLPTFLYLWQSEPSLERLSGR
jgi:protease-4